MLFFMELVLGVFFIALIWLFIFGFIGGFAGAIVGGGREDRSIFANAGIGLIGALIGRVGWIAVTGKPPTSDADLLLSIFGGAILFLVAVAAIGNGKRGRHTLTRVNG